MEVMNDSGGHPSTKSNDRVANLLTARRTLLEHDFFSVPRQQLQMDLQDLMILNEAQKKAIASLGHARGGVNVTQGLPGTGKTHIVVESTIPFVLMPERGIHLVVSPSNKAANDIAVRIHRRIQDQRQNQEVAFNYSHILSEQHAYIVRLESKMTQCAIQDLVGCVREHSSEESSLSTPQEDNVNIDEFIDTRRKEINSVLEILPVYEEIVRDTLRQIEGDTIPAIPGSRVENLSLSVGARMLQAIGLWPNSTASFVAPWPSVEAKHDRFRCLMLRKARGEKLSRSLQGEYGKTALLLYQEILEGARIVVGTTAGAAARGVMTTIRNHIVAITADGSSQEAEAAMLRIFDACSTQQPGIHLVDDHDQPKPMAQVNQRALVADQKEPTLMKRLIDAGHPSTIFVKQYRMHSDIATPTSQFLHDGLLVSAPDLDRRPAGLTFKHLFRSRMGGNYSNAIWFDIKATINTKKQNHVQSKHKVLTSSSGSKSCEFQALHGVNLAVELLDNLRAVKPDGRVAILTQYTDQKKLYMSARQKMKELRWEGFLNLHVETIASARSLEYDYVLLDLVIGDKIGMLCEPEIVNVAMTRAKSGLVVLAPMNAIATAAGNARVLRDYKNYFKKSGRVCKLKNVYEWPPCKYLAPVEDHQPLDLGSVRGALDAIQTVPSRFSMDAGRDFQPPENLLEYDIELIRLAASQL